MKRMIGKKLLPFKLCLVMALPLMACGIKENVAINESNFPDEAFRNYVKGTFDLDIDFALSGAEIAAAKEIHVKEFGIKSLKGVEYFTELTKLDCGYNELTSFDVSANTKLEWLTCSGYTLTSLDVTHNPELTHLYCDRNPIGELDLRNNKKLTHLLCDSNQLKELDVSNNPALVRLQCTRNELTELDVSANHALEQLTCFYNPIEKIDISKCPCLLEIYVNGKTAYEEKYKRE